MPGIWTHRSRGGLDYPVRPGDVWGVGRHRFVCGDIETGDRPAGVRSLNGGIILTDPPWTTSLASGFRTRAGAPGRTDIRSFFGAWAELVTTLRADHLWVVMSGLTQRLMEHELRARGCALHRRWNWKYASPGLDPFWSVWSLPGRPPPPLYGFDPPDTMGFTEGCGPILELYRKGHAVIDPCVGLGAAARAAIAAGQTFTGMELGSHRLSATLAAASRDTGEAPVRLARRGGGSGSAAASGS